MYKWDEMSEQQRDLLVIQTFGFNYNIIDFQPTVDISDAWDVVEKLGIAIIPQSSDAPSNMKYMAVKYGIELDQSDDIRVFCATAPEAICKVALKAVGIEIV